MTSTLSGRDLDRAIAEEMGLHPMEIASVDGPTRMVAFRLNETTWQEIPFFHLSLDALRDGPEGILREAGWILDVTTGGGSTAAGWDEDRGADYGVGRYEATGDTEAEARALAVLAGLRALHAEGSTK